MQISMANLSTIQSDISIISDKVFNESDEFESTNPRARKLQAVAVKVLHPGIKGQLKYPL